ncbi:hypothetical protein [Cupriavidus sp. TA19]|uniref:hypothetical protein n=1 Tax=Cupriavidus sp. TA19 TaxID=701108 RepID=UPI00295EC948|nr:hypothetical protein [Cupriavidus sp. TA19]
MVQLHRFRFLFQGAVRCHAECPGAGQHAPSTSAAPTRAAGRTSAPFAASVKALPAPFSSFPDTGPTPVMAVIQFGYQDENI